MNLDDVPDPPAPTLADFQALRKLHDEADLASYTVHHPVAITAADRRNTNTLSTPKGRDTAELQAAAGREAAKTGL
eukprot:CAMPEP_0206149258 /NCGR_PEP_ID=MMETSP1473-20131121/37687_1 /ASSEMBLY_ACC=CAM_ASM_001109 /TAXON_ID=1461547 /ORGANISM="Stichococcus sp, Strain RCC1054" /LENGTH=75 /DNA_ID=CAMNT_0053546713 /DNA_START=611 /DNA_END=838 /DNA_ORIENTATION=-